MKLAFQWSGTPRLAERLRRAADKAEVQTQGLLQQTGEALRQRAAEQVHAQRAAGRPLPSELVKSLRVAASDKAVEVRAEAAHAVFVEFGTSRMEPAPFLEPAFDETVRELSQRLARRQS